MIKKLLFNLIVLTLLCCNSNNNSKKLGNSKKSVVVVEVPNAEDEKLVLSVKGEGFENQKKQTIKNGKAIFDLNYNNSDIALIESFYNLENINFMFIKIPVLLENDTIILNTEMVKDSIRNGEKFKYFYDFNGESFKKSSNNIKYKKNKNRLFNLAKGITYSVNKLDSLNQKVFPEIRSNAINLFHNNFSKLNHRLQLELFHDMLNMTSFRPEFLNNKEKKAINDIYHKFSKLDQSANYRLKTVEYLVSDINNLDSKKKLSFKNFNLIDSKNNHVNLENIVNQNKYTIFYFWFSGCGPCRAFNKKIDNDILQSLKNNNIKLVSINTDSYKQNWIKSSEQDNIFWDNLYAGQQKEKIEHEYRITSYPTKVIFDKNLDLVEFKFSSPKDLLEIKDLKLNNKK